VDNGASGFVRVEIPCEQAWPEYQRDCLSGAEPRGRRADRHQYLGILRVLHTFTGKRVGDERNDRDWFLSTLWVISMDAVSIGIVIMVFSGLYMWYGLPAKRNLGAAALVLGSVACAMLVFGLRWMSLLPNPPHRQAARRGSGDGRQKQVARFVITVLRDVLAVALGRTFGPIEAVDRFAHRREAFEQAVRSQVENHVEQRQLRMAGYVSKAANRVRRLSAKPRSLSSSTRLTSSSGISSCVNFL
jgi:hypothetical protein